jgi:hypothetical protein
MPNPIRHFEPGRTWFSTATVVGRQFLFAPRLNLSRRERREAIRTGRIPLASVEIREIVGGCLVRALERWPIPIYALIVMASHIQLEHGGDSTNISQFFSEFLGLVAREVNRHLGREGQVFDRRFTPSPCLDDEAIIEKFRYTHANPCDANLVDRAVDYPGLSTARAVTTGEVMRFSWIDRTKYHEARHRGEKVTLADFRVEREFKPAPLPCWERLPIEEQRRLAAEAIREAEERARAKRQAEGSSVMTLEQFLSVDPFDRPKTPRPKTPRPLCHATDRETYLNYREAYWEFCWEYHAASEAFRSGDRMAAFPPHSCPPSLLWVASG